MKQIVLLPILAFVLIGAGCTTSPATTISETTNNTTPTAVVEDATNENTTVTSAVNTTTGTEEPTALTYGGNRLAGTVSPYLEFTQSDYDQAVAAGKTIVLDFYANWCPICRAEEPALISSFNALSDTTVVGFRVNYNDDDTDDAEDALADQFGVTYQHTKVIVRNGQVELKTQNTWDETSLAEALAAL